jgi:mannose-1-phosphate guanylyltransferase/phosphomannomutase
MKAAILAGGFGTRLHPLTVDIPKPMVPMVNRPLMSYIVELLAKHGFSEINVLLHHQPEIIKNYFKDGRDYNVKIKYFEAPEDYGTAGAVKFSCQNEKEPILVISADLLTDIDLSAAIDFHKQKKSFATMVLTRAANPLQYGIVITNKNSRVRQFLEKPSWGEVFSDTINAGIYIIEPEVLELIPFEKSFDFSLDLFPRLLKEKKPIYGFIAEGFWEDIGKHEDYRKTQHEVVNEKIRLSISGKKSQSGFWIGENLQVASSASLEGRGIVGDGSFIADEAVLVDTIIGRNCRVGRGAVLKECVLWDGVEIGSLAKLERAIIGKGVKIGARTTLGEGVVVGDESEIGKEADIRPFIKIWPRKMVEEGSTVSRSIIWREHWSKSIFGQYGVNGICNVEITPQFAAALGAAYGSVLGKGKRLSCSCDSHKASHMIYQGLIAGALSAGVNISNLEMVPIPVNRFEVASLKSQGGFHVRKSPFDPEVMDIKFFDANGMDLSSTSEKKIERKFFGEDFTRTNVEEIGELTYPYHRLAEEYKSGILDHLYKNVIRASNFKLVIDYSFGSASQIFPSILGELGLDVIALDAYIDETKITKDKETFEKSLLHMTQIVKSVGADLGVMLDTGAEKIFLCDEQGRIIEGRQALAIMALMALRSRKAATIAIPIRESSVIEKIAEKYKGKVIRTKNSFRGMMEAAASGSVSFLGEREGGYIFPDFMPSFDGMLSICKILECLSRERAKLSDLAAEIPRMNQLEIDISCSSEQKGRIMRRVADMTKGVDRLETVDGLKFWHGEDWALILPDQTRPVIHFYAEAKSEKDAELLFDKYNRMIDALREE